MSKQLKNIFYAKNKIFNYLNNGVTDNLDLYKILKKENLGLTPGELSRLINKYSEEFIYEEKCNE